MNIYDFAFCFVNRLVKASGVFGRIIGVLAVSFTVCVHLAFFQALVYFCTQLKMIRFVRFWRVSAHPLFFFACVALVIALVIPIYTEGRIDRITKEYKKKYRNIGRRHKMKFLLFYVAPLVAIAVMASWIKILTLFMSAVNTNFK